VLVQLFAPQDRMASITGDLYEEFSRRSSSAGISLARRWYRREAVRTAAVLFVNQLREAPVDVAIRVVATLGALRLANFLIQKAITAILLLHSHEIYQKVSPSNFWLLYHTLFMSAIVPIVAGWTASSLRKGKEMGFGIATSGIIMLINLRWSWRIVIWIATDGKPEIFYYIPNDPAIMVQRRFTVG
jgi:hypothetical protein